MEDLAPIIVIPIFFAIIGWIIRSALEHRRLSRITETQAQLQRQLIEKMGSSEDLLAYLQSDAGHRLISSAALARTNPLARILGAIQAGIILVVVGGALIFLRGLDGLGTDAYTGFTFLGTLTLAVGAGFLIASSVTYGLSKRWGLADPAGPAASGV